jgi:hypothetical protein
MAYIYPMNLGPKTRPFKILDQVNVVRCRGTVCEHDFIGVITGKSEVAWYVEDDEGRIWECSNDQLEHLHFDDIPQ